MACDPRGSIIFAIGPIHGKDIRLIQLTFIIMQFYPAYPAVHEQCAKSREPGVISRFMECGELFLRCE